MMTVDKLIEKDLASSWFIKKFNKLLPHGLDDNEAKALRQAVSVCQDLSFMALSTECFNPSEELHFDRLLVNHMEAYNVAKAPIIKAYNLKVEKAEDKYDLAAAWEVYDYELIPLIAVLNIRAAECFVKTLVEFR